MSDQLGDIDYIRELMNEVPQFDTLLPEEMDVLAELVFCKRIPAGTVLTKEGTQGDSLFYIASGRIEIKKDSLDGRQTVLARFNKGASVGEMSLIEESPRSATAVALDEVEILVLTRQGFEKALAINPQVGVKILKNIAKSLSARLRYTSGRFADVFR